MIGYREPGSLWKIDGIPFVWGPVGGYGWTTLRYLNGQPVGVKMKAVIKNILNIIQGKLYPLSNHAMKRASCVMAANYNVYRYIKQNFRNDVILLNETGCYEKDIPLVDRNSDQEFNLLWVGKFDYRKQLELAIRVVDQLAGAYPYIKLNIVGDKENATYERLAAMCHERNIEQHVVWHGKIPNKRVHELMQQSDVFLFTSIDEGTPHVVLESIQNNLPVVCFDTCGQGDVVNDTVGIKIPLSSASKSPSDFARAISGLINNRQKLHKMRINCSQRQKEMSWDLKMQRVVEIYDSILSSKK